MTTPIVDPELRAVDKRPFGIYATVLLLLWFVAAAALDIVRLRFGFPSRLLQQIADWLQFSSSLPNLPPLFFTNQNILIALNVVIILVTVVTAVGLWFRWRLAWVAAMLLIGIGLVYNIWSYLEGNPLYINMLLHVMAVFYLNERSVRRVFEPRPPVMEARQ